MSIRKQVILAMVLATVVVSTVLSFILYMMISSGFDYLENNTVKQNIDRIHNGLENYFVSFRAKSGDWARWDATYEFVDDLNEEYIRENVVADAFFTLEVNFLIYYNKDLTPVYKNAVNLETEEFVTVPNGMLEQLSNILTPETMQQEEPITSYLQLPGHEPIIFVAYPILRSDGSGPANGVLVFGRYIDTDLIQRLEGITLFPINLKTLDVDLSLEFAQAKKELEKQNNVPNFLIKRGGKDMYGYTMINDVFDQPAFLFKITIPRQLEQQGNQTILYVILSVMVAGLILGITVYMYVEKTILTRLFELGKGINRISTSQYKKVGLYVTGNDEIGHLAKEIEKMVLNLYTVQMDLQKSSERYKGVVESQIDLIIRKDSNGRIVFVNDAYCRKFGLSKENIIGTTLEPYSQNNEGLSFDDIMEKIKYAPYRISLEQKVKTKKGWCWIAWEYAAIRDKQGNTVEIQGVGRDITQLKKNEKALKDRAEELEKLNSLMIGREIKMAELKEKIKKLQNGNS